MRIVTTLPSATEIVAELGFEPVGVSHECDYPPWVGEIPSVTTSRIDADASSTEIDRQVRETGDEGVYEVDVGLLDDLEPDVIVTQGMCDVCAVDEAVIERAVEAITADPEIVTTDPHTVADVLGDIERIGRVTNRERRATEIVRRRRERIDDVRETASDALERPRVAVLDWTDPVMVAGHWTPELVTAAGGEYGMADPADRSTPREWDDVLAYDPEVLVVAPCGFDLEQITENIGDLTEREGWSDLTAVREDRVWAMDGHHYVNRPGPRLVDTLEYLAAIVQPDHFVGPPTDVAVSVADLEREATEP
ncbi:ABC transporter substrate-binding protein [Natrialbaceae archaeon AArc-T1-2]|uniref:ABC transporter substrate-binding protein n=1 Tax=Natrialbaceae archaeon AArc-T1-2 TaxID=3053904 RepID=UPI00255ABB85|nr:ABC transporter substrate-binding protein [Natrialbaceae archaeon AArc-T1-2]WIV68054.1 ABC transporter substrate-binding protein [Natrialbaceae archaeon AArc-T1-2]